MNRRPIWQAYADTGAIDASCTHCGAEPGQWCTRDDGQVRRIPCIARVATSGAISGSRNPRDFSEPSHEVAR